MSHEKTMGDLGSNSVGLEKELVGDTLRKERITRRITVETIAKDLKLNVKYIKALESNDYDALPADPYVRVYLKTLAKYLSLDTDAILKRFYNEKGVVIDRSPREHEEDTTNKEVGIPIDMKGNEGSHKPLVIIIVALIIGVALFSFYAKKKGWLVAPDETTTSYGTADEEFVETDAAMDSTVADSLIPAIPPQLSGNTKTPPTGGLNTLNVTVIGDSVWLQIFSDGISWKDVVYKNQSYNFTADDSFNIHIGDISSAKLTFNGKPLSVAGNGITALKITNKGKVTKWTLTKWNTVFTDRL